jgi:hypothetical protein
MRSLPYVHPSPYLTKNRYLWQSKEFEGIGLLLMRCYCERVYRGIQFDKAGYQRFLREQGLSEHDIKRLNIHLITDFTCSHFKGCADLAPGGVFFGRCREYLEKENRATRAFYRPYDPPCDYAAIFLRPKKCFIFADLNIALLHETRHHLQHCLKLPCCSTVNARVENEANGAENQPWEIDAVQFARDHGDMAFLIRVALDERNNTGM